MIFVTHETFFSITVVRGSIHTYVDVYGYVCMCILYMCRYVYVHGCMCMCVYTHMYRQRAQVELNMKGEP